MRRTTRSVLVLLTAIVAGLFTGAPPAAAAGTTITLPSCCALAEIGAGGAVYVLSQDLDRTERPTLVRIDPAAEVVTGTMQLPTGVPTGNDLVAAAMTYAAGSIWIPASFHNRVLRIDPRTMQITARVGIGRGAASIATDGTSVWVSERADGVLAEIDPAVNAVVRTVHLGARDGTDGPGQLAFNGDHLLVTLPESGRVAHVNPVTGRVLGYDAVGSDAAACARVEPAPGGYWLDDTLCSYSYFRWDAAAGRITVEVNPQPRGDFGSVVVGRALYTGEFRCGASGCTRGFLVKYDAVTGALLAQRVVAVEAFLPGFAGGEFWVADWDDGTVHSVARF